MSQEPEYTLLDDPARDRAVERALHFFMGRKGLRPLELARESGVSRGTMYQAVMGYTPSVATLRRLSSSLGVELWLLLLVGDMLSMDEPALRRFGETSEGHRLIVQGVELLLEAEGMPPPGKARRLETLMVSARLNVQAAQERVEGIQAWVGDLGALLAELEPDPEILRLLDRVIERVAASQEAIAGLESGLVELQERVTAVLDRDS